VVEGFERTESRKSLHVSLESGADLITGGFAADAAFGGVSLMLMGLSVFRETRAVQRGEKSTEAAVVDAALTIGVLGTGMLAGAFMGGKAGATAGLAVDAVTGGFSLLSGAAIGGTIGTVGGGVAGSAAGRNAVRVIRGAPLRASEAELRTALAVYGEKCIDDHVLVRMREMVERPVVRARQAHGERRRSAQSTRTSVRWHVWPSAGQVLMVETARYADTAVISVETDAGRIREDLDSIATCQDPAVAVGRILTNEPDLRKAFGAEITEFGRVEDSYLKVQSLRRQVDRPVTSSETFHSVSRVVRRWFDRRRGGHTEGRHRRSERSPPYESDEYLATSSVTEDGVVP
jgi:hypothetical protein